MRWLWTWIKAFFGVWEFPEPKQRLPMDFVNDLEAIAPGRALTIKVRQQEYVIMHADDFDHCIKQGGLHRRAATEKDVLPVFSAGGGR